MQHCISTKRLVMLAASSVRFLVKYIISIFTKQSDKPFSAYAQRCVLNRFNSWTSLLRLKMLNFEVSLGAI
jgi:hypothetical protein